MKNWLVKISKPLLTAAMAFGFWISCDIASVFFFGEFEYPVK